MSDRLTPGQLRDLAELLFGEVPHYTKYTLYEEAQRREAEAKPQNGRGHIPLITCPGSNKSCMGYDCLDKGCLDGEPKPTHVCNFVDSDQVGVSICHGCGRKLMPKGLSVDALRSANISIGGCEVCTTPTGCKQEKHCDHFNMAFYSEREGPGSAAAPKPPIIGDAWYRAGLRHPEDKPAPAAGELHGLIDKLSDAVARFRNSMHGQSQTDYKAQADALNARDEIKALFAAEKARADRLAAALKPFADAYKNWPGNNAGRHFRELATPAQYRAAFEALASEGGDRAKA